MILKFFRVLLFLLAVAGFVAWIIYTFTQGKNLVTLIGLGFGAAMGNYFGQFIYELKEGEY